MRLLKSIIPVLFLVSHFGVHAVELNSNPVFPYAKWKQWVQDRGTVSVPELMGYEPVTDASGQPYTEKYYSDNFAVRLVCTNAGGCNNFRLYSDANVVGLEYADNTVEYFGFQNAQGVPVPGIASLLIDASLFTPPPAGTNNIFALPSEAARNTYGNYFSYKFLNSGYRFDGNKVYQSGSDMNSVPYNIRVPYTGTIGYMYLNVKAMKENVFVFGTTNKLGDGRPSVDRKKPLNLGKSFSDPYVTRGYVWQKYAGNFNGPKVSKEVTNMNSYSYEHSFSHALDAGLTVRFNLTPGEPVSAIITNLFGGVGFAEFSFKDHLDWGTTESSTLSTTSGFSYVCDSGSDGGDKEIICPAYRLALATNFVAPGLQEIFDKFQQNTGSYKYQLKLGSESDFVTDDDSIHLKNLQPTGGKQGSTEVWGSFNIAVPSLIRKL